MNLGSLGGDQSGAVAVNDNGEVVGTSDGHLFAWTAGGGMVDLGGLGGGSASPSALNNSGQVVGTGYTATGYFHAFSYTKGGGMVDLGTLGGSNSFATAVSATGEVVGFSQTAHNAATDVFVWTTQHGMVALGRSTTTCLDFACYPAVNDARGRWRPPPPTRMTASLGSLMPSC